MKRKKYISLEDLKQIVKDVGTGENIKRLLPGGMYEKTEGYKKFLKGIGSYKLQELINIAMEHEIDVVENKKRKTKQQLYNEININVVV